MDVRFESISPGIYEVVWEMNIYNLQKAQRFQFITKILHQVIKIILPALQKSSNSNLTFIVEL